MAPEGVQFGCTRTDGVAVIFYKIFDKNINKHYSNFRFVEIVF